MKVGAYGVIFIFMLIIFIIVTGIVAFTNTEFMVGPANDVNGTNWSEGLRTITMVHSNFSPLAGILGLGYFLHPASLPIVRSSANPEKVDRDLFNGYLSVFVTYIIIGVMGYIGFVGTDFTDYFISKNGSDSAG